MIASGRKPREVPASEFFALQVLRLRQELGLPRQTHHALGKQRFQERRLRVQLRRFHRVRADRGQPLRLQPLREQGALPRVKMHLRSKPTRQVQHRRFHGH